MSVPNIDENMTLDCAAAAADDDADADDNVGSFITAVGSWTYSEDEQDTSTMEVVREDGSCRFQVPDGGKIRTDDDGGCPSLCLSTVSLFSLTLQSNDCCPS